MARLAIAGLALAALSTAVLPAHAENPDARGQPTKSQVAGAEGYLVWQDATGWHLRTLARAQGFHFQGTVLANGTTFAGSRGIGLERTTDTFKVARPPNVPKAAKVEVMTFDFTTTANESDGVDFKLAATDSIVAFTLKIAEKDGAFVQSHTFIGSVFGHPSSSPFSFKGTGAPATP